MGFGTSGSLLVVFTGLFIAMGTLYTATGNVSEQLNEAGETQNERFLAAQETDVTVTRAEWNTTESNLTVAVENGGERALSVEHTDVVVDGTYVPVEVFERADVDGVSTDTWRPGEVLVLEDADTVADFPAAPGRVKVVTETAVADVAEVTVVP
ncbi:MULTISPECIES: flagellin [Salinibaculum]|uniref:flagellin n=1 Tax=Salinibaculum TaxID=2732368 RepID=UPI0030CE19B4